MGFARSRERFGGRNGEVACDHYRYEDALMKEIGIRLPPVLSWPHLIGRDER
jgi:hypothetical protein